MRLSVKIVILIGLVLTIMLVLTGMVSVTKEEQLLSSLLEKRGKELSHTISVFSVELLLAEDYPVLDSFLEITGREKEDILSIEVIQEDAVVSSFFREPVGSRKQDVMKHLVEFESDVNFSPFEDEKPVKLGTVRLGLSNRANQQILSSRRWEVILQVVIVFLILFVTLFLVLHHVVLEKVDRLDRHAKLLGSGNLDARIDLKAKDELGTLGESLNKMSSNLLASRKQIEAQNEELKKLDGMKDDFLSNVTHELKTPLNGILGFSSSLLQGYYGKLSGELKEPIGLIEKSGNRLLQLVDKLLRISPSVDKGETAAEMPSNEPVSLGDMAREIVGVVEHTCRSKNISISSDVPCSHVLNCDSVTLRSVLQNLIDNAIKFTDAGGVYLKSNSINEGKATIGYRLVVRDTGIGIPVEVRDRIFEKFVQGFPSENRSYGGSGIGLAIVKSGVKDLGGELSLESQPGAGTVFTLLLPAEPSVAVERLQRNCGEFPVKTAREESVRAGGDDDDATVKQQRSTEAVIACAGVAAPGEQTASVAEANSDRRTVLVVDDDAINRKILETKLRGHYDVLTASGGKECLDLLGHSPVDLVLLDIMMPEMSGYEVLEHMPEEPYVPVICVSAKDRVSSVRRALDSGAVDYVTKPFNEEELKVRINRHLRIRDALVRAEDSAREKSRFFEARGQDLRAFLSRVQDLTGSLEGAELTWEQRGVVSEMRNRADSLVAMIDDVLELARPESGAQIPDLPSPTCAGSSVAGTA